MAYSPLFRGSQAKGSGRAISSNYQNGTLSTLIKSTPVSVNSLGQLVNIDVLSQNSVQSMVGLVASDIASGSSGPVIDCGRLEDITASFSIGDAIYLNYDGGLTNTKPEEGVSGFTSGMFVVFIGVIIKNEYNPIKKDIKLMISLVGQL